MQQQIKHLTNVQRREITRLQQEGIVTITCSKLLRAYKTLWKMRIVVHAPKYNSGIVFILAKEWQKIDVSRKPKPIRAVTSGADPPKRPGK